MSFKKNKSAAVLDRNFKLNMKDPISTHLQQIKDGLFLIGGSVVTGSRQILSLKNIGEFCIIYNFKNR